LQHFEPALYRDLKLAILRTTLERVGIDPGVIETLQQVPPARRRARLGVMRPCDPHLFPQIGFRQRFRHDLIDIAQCPVLAPALFAVVAKLRQRLAGLLPPGVRALEACAGLAGESALARVVWRAPTDEILVVEHRSARVLMSGVAVPYPPGAFLQPSLAAEKILIDEVLAGVGAHQPVLDLFAGLGTFAFALARSGAVHAVEGEPRAAAALAEAAASRRQVSVEQRDLARNPVPPRDLSRYAAAVFDPPRNGALRQAEALAASTLDTVVAVSCNSATFARDAATLVAGGFHLEQLTPVDQFVWTPHLEIVALFRR
jgi:23S rRNA (uracil1939-C5)-methyltransferase